MVAYSTCEKFLGLAARRLSPTGVPVGKAVSLPLPARPSSLALAARGPADFVTASVVFNPTSSFYTHGVVNGKVFGPTRLGPPAGYAGVFLGDIAASPTGYLLVYLATRGNAPSPTVFAQELDVQGRPVGAPLKLTPDTETGLSGAVASLPDNRWIVVTRWKHGQEEACRENIVGTILSSD